MKRYTEACDFVAERAFVLRLHKVAYREIRECFGLSSQLAIRVISKVVESYKHSKKPSFKSLGAIQYYQRNSRISIDKVSIMTLQGRVGDYQRQRWDRGKIKESDLIYKNVFVQDVPEEKEYDSVGVLDIDLGIENIAVDSDREIFESKKVENTRHRYFRLRKILQHIGTRSAYRKLRKISGKERRFKKDTNHCISKYIISKVKGDRD
jgi:putative transposase